jgi:Holliday junction resolvasome RuvABC ATP-dependent DNA helicase subunit
MFIGRKDVLDKLMEIFVHGADRRHSCLLFGTGGIGKTQICLKFTEEISDR